MTQIICRPLKHLIVCLIGQILKLLIMCADGLPDASHLPTAPLTVNSILLISYCQRKKNDIFELQEQPETSSANVTSEVSEFEFPRLFGNHIRVKIDTYKEGCRAI